MFDKQSYSETAGQVNFHVCYKLKLMDKQD